MTLEEIHSSARVVLDNAYHFLAEGTFFEKTAKAHHHRAAAMYQLTIEETGKAFLLLQYYRNRKLLLQHDTNDLCNAFRSHRLKTKEALEVLRLSFNKWALKNDLFKEHVKVVELLMSQAHLYDDVRERGLYTDVKDGLVRSPNELVSIAEMDHVRLVAIAAYGFIDQYWYGILGNYEWGSKGFLARGKTKMKHANHAGTQGYLAMLASLVPVYRHSP